MAILFSVTVLACSLLLSVSAAEQPAANTTDEGTGLMLVAAQETGESKTDEMVQSAVEQLKTDPNTVSMFFKKSEFESLAETPIPFGIKDLSRDQLAQAVDDSWAELDSQSFHSKAASCAVVGNAGTILNAKFGADIDQHDVVWRFNDAPTETFEDFVGSKTSYRIAGNNQIGKARSKHVNVMDNGKVLYYFHRGGEKEGNRNVQYFLNNLQGKGIMFSPAFLQYTYTSWIGDKVHMWGKSVGVVPSSGMLAVVMALRTCAHVDVYGFDLNSPVAHYYDKQKADYKTVNHHSFIAEEKVRMQLARLGHITLHSPDSEVAVSLTALGVNPGLCTGWPCADEDE